MPRPALRRALRAPVLCAAALVTVSACSGTYLEMGDPQSAGPSASRTAPSASGTGRPASPSPEASPALTAAQAQAALVTSADLGWPWEPTRGAATWRDGLLKATTPQADCRRLLDALYADELLGPSARAVIGLDDTDSGAQLHYQVVERSPAEVDRTLAWMRTLPRTCARFPARTVREGVQTVQVADAPLPAVGDARQGLRVTLTGPADPDTGVSTVLVLDVAVVRVGVDALAVTTGGFDQVPAQATQAAVQLGAQRLAEVRKQGRADV
ncbi:hypothetical protein ACL02U_19920 [Streptomyces sp. MS06]|uniref:hypothetical protein n=1 Tax=Streptomyces sp. MS06 TaxID=3385974 RepID=UPI0039A2C2D0